MRRRGASSPLTKTSGSKRSAIRGPSCRSTSPPLVPEKFGWLFLQVDPGRPKEEWERFLKVCIQVTELGLSAKFSPENSVVWVTELKTGLPVPDAAVEIRDDGNLIKWRGRTDAAGKASAPGWRALGLMSREEWREPQQWVFATRGRDTAFASSEWGTGIDPYSFGISYEWSPRPSSVQGYVFTDRGIYRAGEEVHVKTIVRRSEGGRWTVPDAGTPLSLEIQDPFQESVFEGEAALDEFGSLAFDFTPPEDAALGNYGITVTSPPPPPERSRRRTPGLSASRPSGPPSSRSSSGRRTRATSLAAPTKARSGGVIFLAAL